MRKTISLALAGALAVSAVAVTAGEASAGHKGDRAAIAIFSAIAGLAAAAAARPNYYYPPPPYGYYGYQPYYAKPYYNGRYYGGPYSAHVEWCLSRYRTYNPATNTYFRRAGVPAVCYSPYG